MPHDRRVKLRGDRSIESKLMRLSNELADDAARVSADYPERHMLVIGLREASENLADLASSIAGPKPVKAEFGCCEEAALGIPFYLPCNKSAVAVLRWRGRSDPAIRVCSACLDHNVRNRGGEILRYVDDWVLDEANNP